MVDTLLTAEHGKMLLERGFFVVDGIFGTPESNLLRNEIVELAQGGRMKENRVRFGSDKILTKPNIFEADLHDSALRARTKAFSTLFSDNWIVRRLRRILPGLGIQEGVEHVTIKLQWNRGSGGCFPFHYDNPGRPNKRCLTCLVYLNPSWKEGDGGELELLPFLRAPEIIAPVHDRLVVFRSDRVLHRVRPATRQRFCFTIWIDSEVSNVDDDVYLKAKHLKESAIPFLKSSPLQRILSRPVYDEEYIASIVACMGEGTPASAVMLAGHRHHVNSLKQNPNVAAFVETLRRKKHEKASPVVDTDSDDAAVDLD